MLVISLLLDRSKKVIGIVNWGLLGSIKRGSKFWVYCVESIDMIHLVLLELYQSLNTVEAGMI